MTLNFQLVENRDALPRITVVGVGGAGGNAVDNMMQSHLEGVDFVVANTDAQALAQSPSERQIQLGSSLTRGLGAGARPDVGREAAEESIEDVVDQLDGSNMVFITAGMGGGTGTGAAPVIARAVKERGILTVAVVTKPFQFEGSKRMRMAEEGIEELQKYVDTLIVIPNQNLFRLASADTSFADAFKMADDVLHMGVRGVTDLIVVPGMINLDFADISTVMSGMGKAMMGTGEATGDNRALEAAEKAISNPLLEDTSMSGAKQVLVNVTGGSDLTLHEVDTAVNRIRDEIHSDANIIFGTAENSDTTGHIRISVVATGMSAEENSHDNLSAGISIPSTNGGRFSYPQSTSSNGGGIFQPSLGKAVGAMPQDSAIPHPSSGSPVDPHKLIGKKYVDSASRDLEFDESRRPVGQVEMSEERTGFFDRWMKKARRGLMDESATTSAADDVAPAPVSPAAHMPAAPQQRAVAPAQPVPLPEAPAPRREMALAESDESAIPAFLRQKGS